MTGYYKDFERDARSILRKVERLHQDTRSLYDEIRLKLGKSWADDFADIRGSLEAFSSSIRKRLIAK